MCPTPEPKVKRVSETTAPLATLLKDFEDDPAKVQRISFRTSKAPLEVVPFDPAWARRFEELRDRIVSALGPFALSVAHTGSTSIIGIPAKPVIDIDLVVSDLGDEDTYVPALEAAGFQFLLREPEWHGHRFFCGYEPISCNLHVWGTQCPEVERHRIFRDWLLGCDEDRELYAQTKAEAMVETVNQKETVMEYNKRKEQVIRQILDRAFRSLGYRRDAGAEGDAFEQA